MKNDKLLLNYIMSAPGMTGVFTSLDEYPDVVSPLRDYTIKATNQVRTNLKNICKNTTPEVDILYNAYTEARLTSELELKGNLGFSEVYADSGGLQIVTAGKEITEDLKNSVYKNQTYADFAMCFDVIPLSSISDKRTRNERSNTKNKIFRQDDHREAGRLTGINIKNQADYFRSQNAKTKIIIIVQGNTAQDMEMYFREIEKQLKPEDYDYIGGMAVADTCMGNGEAESIEMLKGARIITKDCHENVKKHLHILGVGSITRMRPVIYLINSGYISNFQQVSYDSSSHTCCYDYGLVKLNGTCKPLGGTGTKKAVEYFSDVYDLFNTAIPVDKDKFLYTLFGDRTIDWKFSTVKARAFETKDTKIITTALMVKMLHTLYMINNFVYNVDLIKDTYSKSQGIETLRKVSCDYTMELWEKHNLNTKSIKTKRINRDDSFSSLEGFF